MHKNAQIFFSLTTLCYSMVKTAHLGDIFSEIFELESSPVEGQSLQQKDKKRRKKKKRESKKRRKKEKLNM